MKSFSNWILCALITGIIFLFASCEKVVTIDLKDAGARVVVQANVTNTPGPYTVALNSSVSYYSNNTFPAITGAQVKISDNAGNSESLTETSQGVYQTSSLIGTTGRTYYLEITAAGKTYNASSIMHNVVPIDSLSVQPTTGRNNQPNGYRVGCKFTDPPGLGNYYRVVISSNHMAALGSQTSRVISDKLSDGGHMSVTFRTKLQSLDTVSIELQCVDKSTYDFYNTLNSAVGTSSVSQFLASLPANPTNNISNSGLGYFAAYATTTHTVVIP